MNNKCIQEYEEVLKNIVLDDKTYDYLYLFSPEYSFPLLNPVPYNKEDTQTNARDENVLLRDKEINNQFQIFKDNNYSLFKLIKAAIEVGEYYLGEVLAKYYCKNVFDKEIFELLLEHDSNGNHVYDYVRKLCYAENVNLSYIIKTIKERTNNNVLVANIIGLEVIGKQNCAIISQEDEVVKKNIGVET